MIETAAHTFQDIGPLLTLALVIVVGVMFGIVAQRIGLPAITGQIIAGAAVGRVGLDLFGDESLHALEPLTNFALGLIAVTVGAHLNIRRLRNAGRRLFLLMLAECTILPAIVFICIWGSQQASLELTALLAAVSIATAPATIVAIVKESRAKGVFVKTLIAAVALNNMSCIVLFEVVRVALSAWTGRSSGLEAFVAAGTQVIFAAGIGTAIALAMDLAGRLTVKPERVATAAVVALMMTSGLASALNVSPLLACLFLGLVQTNLTRSRAHLVDSVFANFEPAILAVFFTLAGMHLSPDKLGVAGFVAGIYFVARICGKLAAASVAMRFANATSKVRENLGLALIPQAGVAVGLVIIIQEDPNYSELAGLFSAIVLTVVTVNEIVGPLLTRTALRRAGEAGMDRMRLIDFLQEENIVTNLKAKTKEEAIEKLVDLMISSHHLEGMQRDTLLQTVLDRERQASTCLGGGLAVPHCILPAGLAMVGVMGLSREGLHFDTPDNHPVHCMVLLGTSPEERNRHLEVLAGLARTVGIDLAFQDQLFNSTSAAHACELLHGEESEDFNYFLEEE